MLDAGAPGSGTELVLDLSRLISRVRHVTPTGVDRVEMAYARGLARLAPGRVSYAARHPLGAYGRLSTRRAERFLDAVERKWAIGGDRSAPAPRGWAGLLHAMWRVRPAPVPAKRGRRAFVLASPHHLHRQQRMRSILAREGAGFVCLLHDLIPLQFPEYARPGGAAKHLARMRTVAGLADAIIANSAATAEAFRPYLTEAGRQHVPMTVAHLGLHGPVAASSPARLLTKRPYFVALGTIEPRKNHLLLLHLWRDLAQRLPDDAVPGLVIVGRRGWENEQVVDMLERCPGLSDHVEERSGLPDGELAELLAGAAGLLLPSFAEGFGMPVPEALAAGVPVICSDLPALREAGGNAPLFLDPLDGPGWRRAVLALADPRDPLRSDLLARLRGWRAPTWNEHLTVVLDQAERAAR